MIKKIFLFSIALIILSVNFAKADEGMWLLNLLNKNYADMKAQGFKLTTDDIYNINKASVKDAIVSFGGFCTGEIISNQGLILTNHHCGYGAIQMHSTVENDYLEDGFWAKTLADEIPTPDLYVKFLVRIDDVTDKILKKVTTEMTETQRTEVVTAAKELVIAESDKEYSADKGYETKVQSFFDGNTYYKLVYQKYTDIRFVGAPPSSIGKFGYDTDNWMWPRHTGDFSMFRVYSDKNGNPAEYSAENIPFEPKYFLPISLKGYQPDDFAFVMGYPGSTDRYLTSYGVEELINIQNTNRAKIRGIRQEIMMADMLADPKIMIQYASKYARSSNYWKYSIGQNKGLKKLNVIEQKQEAETTFTKWVNADKTRLAKYGQALTLLQEAYTARADYSYALQYTSECLRRGIEFITFAKSCSDLYDYMVTNGSITQDNELITTAQTAAEDFFKDYSPSTDKKVAIRMLQLYAEDVDAKYYPEEFVNILKKYNSDYTKFIGEVFDNSVFVDETKFAEFLKNPTKEKFESDLAFVLAMSVHKKYLEILALSEEFDHNITKGRRLFIDGLIKIYPDKIFYPDANSTMRFTYGTVGNYSPADAVVYDYYTTIDGIIEKEDPDNWEFYVDPKLKALYEKKDYGKYADSDGNLRVCFTTNNDITGGNSGSPVMNGNGELIGLAFDGNWEAMSGDIAFETELQKCINVDIRYVLFIIDKFAGATRLTDEMKFVQ